MSELILKKQSIKTKTIGAVLAVACAVALPQIFHFLGAVSGLGTSLGEAFLPMHIPVLLAGFLFGPIVGFAVGALSPVISFLISGMPTAAVMPFMIIELASYGVVAGFFKNSRVSTVLGVLTAQVAGRAVRAAAVLIAFYGIRYTAIPVASIWKSAVTGLFGIALQLVLIPLILYRIKGKKNV